MVQDVEKAIKISDGYSSPQNTFIQFIHNHVSWFLQTDGYQVFILRDNGNAVLVLNTAPCHEAARGSYR